MKYEICSRYIYTEMRVTPDQGHDEASFSTKKTYIEQQRREQWGDYRNPPPPPQT